MHTKNSLPFLALYILLTFTNYAYLHCTQCSDIICWYCVSAGARYISISSYQASRDDELSFVRGAVVKVLKKYIDGWWLVRYAANDIISAW